MMPFYIGGYWTIPILPINKDLYKQKWNKPLAMIQAFLIPIVVSQLPKIYYYTQLPIYTQLPDMNYVIPIAEQKIEYH